jgi:hypothetical protein
MNHSQKDDTPKGKGPYIDNVAWMEIMYPSNALIMKGPYINDAEPIVQFLHLYTYNSVSIINFDNLKKGENNYCIHFTV